MTVITMTREMATRGSEVALGVAERLGLDIIHHEVVEHDIATRTGLRESEVHRFLSGGETLFDRWNIDRARMSRYTALEILELVAKGNVLIRGWGATYLLRSVPHVASFRISAPMDYRKKVLMERLRIEDPVAARREIERNDAAHNGAMQRLFGVNWRDPAFYAAMFNTARVPVPLCVDEIVRIAQSETFKETEASKSAFMDSLIEARVNDALEREFGRQHRGFGFQADVKQRNVILHGATTDTTLIVEVLKLLQEVEGVEGVENHVKHVDFVPHAVSLSQ